MSTPECSSTNPFGETTACFSVRTEADPSALSRVVEFFALLNLVPDSVRARRFADNTMLFTLKVRGLSDHRIEVITHKLRSVVIVSSVSVEVFAVGGDLADYRDDHRPQIALAQSA